jgi:hypothetical protein
LWLSLDWPINPSPSGWANWSSWQGRGAEGATASAIRRLAGKYLNAFPSNDELMHTPAGWTERYSPMQGKGYTQYDYTLNEHGQQVVYGDALEDYGSDVYARQTLAFIERSIQAGEPFFAHVSVYAPHWPTTPALARTEGSPYWLSSPSGATASRLENCRV